MYEVIVKGARDGVRREGRGGNVPRSWVVVGGNDAGRGGNLKPDASLVVEVVKCTVFRLGTSIVIPLLGVINFYNS